jgi:hypothetical protein
MVNSEKRAGSFASGAHRLHRLKGVKTPLSEVTYQMLATPQPI